MSLGAADGPAATVRPRRALRILIVGVNYAPEHAGIGPYTTGLAEHLSRAGHGVTVLTGMPHYPAWSLDPAYARRLRAEEHRNGVRVLRRALYVPPRQSAFRRALYEASFLATALPLTRVERPDAILGIVPSLSGAVLARLLAARYRTRYGLLFQDLMSQAAMQSGISGGGRVAAATRMAERWAVSRAQAVAAVIAVLWTQLSGYLNACLRELASRPGVELLVAHQAAGEDAPFETSQFSWMPERLEYGSRSDREGLLAAARQFAPEVLLVNSWHIAEFRYVLERLRPRPLRVLCMDNQWRGTWKQRLGVVTSPWYVRRLYEVAFLPGERQACFARRLGFPDDRIWQGLWCPDTAMFVAAAGTPPSPLPRAFGYLGRLSPEKGIHDLLPAYELYRASSDAPWDLHVAGAAPLSPELDRHPTVMKSGFVQPAELGAWMQAIGCLVVPSRSERWSVALAEGAWAGLPIIATDACGAVPHLVHDFANGRLARTGDVRSLAECMTYVASLSDDERLAMGRVSRGLASPYTPARWADTVLARSSELLADRVPR